LIHAGEIPPKWFDEPNYGKPGPELNLRPGEFRRDIAGDRLLTDAATIFSDFSELKIRIRFREGKPNLEAREDIKITGQPKRFCPH
jgi:hypothetical protein